MSAEDSKDKFEDAVTSAHAAMAAVSSRMIYISLKGKCSNEIKLQMIRNLEEAIRRIESL